MTNTHERDDSTPTVADLIVIGRDREALAVAARDSGPDHTRRAARATGRGRGGPMDGAQQLDEIMPLLEELVDGIGAGQLGAPTPCATFTVEGVLEHMTAGATAFAPAFRGEPASAVPATTGTIQDRWRAAMAELLAAVHSPGALDRTVAAPIGEVPGGVFARFVAFDGLVHGWDLATATGQPYAPDPELAAEVEAFVRQALTDGMRDGDTFAAETPAPPDAGPLERIVAFTGRSLPTGETP